jgi:hypothetical protein
MTHPFCITCLLLLNLIGLTSKAAEKAEPLASFLLKLQTTFEKGTLSQLDSLFPMEEQKLAFKTILERNWLRKKGVSKVLFQEGDSALVLLTGRVKQGDWGLETFYASFYNGLYVLKKTNDFWQIHSKLALDEGNWIKSQQLDVSVQPAQGLTVIDTLTIEVANPYGFFAILNQATLISGVNKDGKPLPYAFDDGLLWLKVPQEKNARIVLSYSLPIQNDLSLRSGMGMFSGTCGHVRQNYWHPHFTFSSSHDRAQFTLRATIPANYQLLTSLPQTDEVKGDTRMIKAKSAYLTSYLALYYDQGWQKSSLTYKGVNIDIFASPTYKPRPEELFTILRENFDIPTEKFGPPQSNYLAILQNRAVKSNGWSNRTNDIIVSSNEGSYMLFAKPFPKAIIMHELSHGWTTPTGPARLFLMEGWATFAESYLLGKTFGDSTIKLFWQKHRENYFSNPYQGKISLWNDVNTTGLSYSKGAWVFKMLGDMMGTEVLEKGLKQYIQHPASGRKDIFDFVKALSDAYGQDLWPIVEPWLKSTSVPRVKARIVKGQLLIEQIGDVFRFPLQVRVVTADKSIRKTYWIKEKNQAFPSKDIDLTKVSKIELDPNKQLLLEVEQ